MTREIISADPLAAAGAFVRWGELYGSCPAYFLAEAAASTPAPLLVVSTSGREADQILAELAFFTAGMSQAAT